MTSVRVAGHFGELLQGRLGPSGPVALVSLPCPALWVEARQAVGNDFHGLVSPAQVRTLRETLDLADPGPLALSATMPRGGGAGASTAALVAYARAAGSAHDPLTLARACIRAEGASDPLMFPDPTRLRRESRSGCVAADLAPLPRLAVIGGFWGPNRRTDPADAAFPDISDLVQPWHEAAGRGDLAALGQLASRSAGRCLALRGPRDDPTAALAGALGALGYVIAHTGSVRGLLFAPGTIPPTAATALADQGFRRLTVFEAGGLG